MSFCIRLVIFPLRYNSLRPLSVIITSISDFSIQYDELLSLLRVEWASGDDTRTLRASAEKLLQLELQIGVRNLLLNMNTFPDISVYDQLWLGTHWLPGIAKLPLERLVVVNSGRRVHNQMAIDSLIVLARPFIKFDIQFFPQAASGLQWLSDYSEHLPALLAEWDAVYGPSTHLPAGTGKPEYRSQV